MHEAHVLRREGLKVSEIAERLGKSERTIYHYLEEAPRIRKKRTYESKLDDFKSFIDSVLEEDPKYNRVILFERIQCLGYTGGITILREYAAQKSNQIITQAVVRFETEPGKQAQVDWKIIGKREIGGKLQKLYAFVMVFGYSRAPFVMHTTSMDQSTILACHVKAFEYFEGIPHEILYDNMKTAFIYDRLQGRWKVNKHLLSLATHYGFRPLRCRVRRPQTKGKVERFIDYYTRNFWQRAVARITSLAALDEQALRWISYINGKPLRQFGESRAQRFEAERNHLLRLPQKPFDWRIPTQTRVSRDSLVCFRTNWYSVPPTLIGEEVSLLFDPMENSLEIINGSQMIRTVVKLSEKRHQRYYRNSDVEALWGLWESQQKLETKIPKSINSQTPVIVRSPRAYEQLFSSQEAC